MSHFEIASILLQARPSGQDRLVVFEAADGAVLLVADGAGGTAGGGEAASFVVDFVLAAASGAPLESLRPQALLLEADQLLARQRHGGQTTAVVVVVWEGGVRGASVGDSGALLLRPAGLSDLTCHQARKPLLGAGDSTPVGFEAGPLEGTLVLASDGLLKYAPPKVLQAAAGLPDLSSVPSSMVESVRLRSGGLPDDVAVVVCRAGNRAQTVG